MSDISLVESEKSLLIKTLDSFYGSSELWQLPSVAESLEILLVKHLQIEIARLAPLLCRCTKPSRSPYLIAEDGAFYQLAVAPDSSSSGVLNICIVLRGLCRPKPPRRKTVRLKAKGYYKKIRLTYSPSLCIDLELFAAFSSAIFETGYVWFRDQVDRLAAKAEISLVDDLYAVAKRLLAREEVLATLWFATITEGYGCRLIERNVANKAFDLIDRYAHEYGHSTNTFVADLLTTRLPRDGLLMNVSVNLNRDLEKADLKNAKYKQEGSLYAATMAALYGGEVFTISPIYVSSQLSVLALFPTELCDPVLDILRQHKSEFSNAVETAAERIGQAVHIFEQRRNKRFHLDVLNKFLLLEPNFFGLGLRLSALFDYIGSWRHKTQTAKLDRVELSERLLLLPKKGED